jgi:hypothetical protein
MLKKRFVLIFLVLAVLLASIVVILQLNSRNQAAQSVNLKSLAMISSLDGWAIGDSSQRNPVILHYDGSQWKTTKNTILDSFMSLSSIKMVSSTEGWIVGETTLPFSNGSSQSRPVGVILHYIKGKWILISDKMPPVPVLRGLFVLSAHNVWAVGDEGTILHYQNDTWNVYKNMQY